ncbi:MAG TPA: hypothetical protein VNM14_17885 [Planctomycetota bacterium]|jgi:hypothetical protein|nr:hypothetical protein [Planctomycetota bacterium]
MKALLLLLLVLAQDGDVHVREAAAESSKSRHRAVLRIFEDHPELLKSDPQAQYLAGHSWMRLHRPELAKPLLGAAVKGGFGGYPGWESAEALLKRIDWIERLRPPPAKDLPEDEALKSIRVFADDTPWIRAVLQALPNDVRRAKEVFGDELPQVDFYLFRSRLAFKDFYKSLFGVDIPTAWQNGTGNSNVVVFCQEDREGKPVNAPGSPRALGDVLHEYGHALLHTIYGDGYLRRVPQWFDEGVSDFVARDHYKELFETSAAQIKKTLATSAAPSSEDLSRRLYERDPALRYAMARYMVDEILKGRKPEVIREILKQARPEGDFEKAILDATGSKASEFRDRVIARFR